MGWATSLGRCSRALLVVALAHTGCGRIWFDEVPDAPRSTPRTTLRLDRIAPAEPLVDFVLPIVLDETRADFSVLTPESLRVFADGIELPLEIEDAGLPLVAWVRVPRIEGTTTELTLEYGGAARTTGSPWAATYLGVWHMIAAPTQLDSAPSGHHGIATATSAATGVISPATAFSITQRSCVIVSTFTSLAFPYVTLSGWIRLNAGAGGAGFYTLLTRQLNDAFSDDFILAVEPDLTGLGALAVPASQITTFRGPQLMTETWHQLVYSYDGTVARWLVDGALVDEGPASGMPSASARPLFIGCGRNSATPPVDADSDYVDGELDELRIESVGRSLPWLLYDYQAQRDQVISYVPQ